MNTGPFRIGDQVAPAQALDDFIQSPSGGWTLGVAPRVAQLLGELDDILWQMPQITSNTPSGRQRHSLLVLRHLLANQADAGRDLTEHAAGELHNLFVMVRASRLEKPW